MQEVISLFPTPFMRVSSAMTPTLVSGLAEHFSAVADRENNSSTLLTHTAMLRPSDSPLLVEAAALITPLLVDFGALLFGERMGWSLKEMWVNVLDTGGRQAMHNHANSFISGVVYLTPTHADARTVFMMSWRPRISGICLGSPPQVVTALSILNSASSVKVIAQSSHCLVSSRRK